MEHEMDNDIEGVYRGYLWLARNEGTEPYSSPYITRLGFRVWG